MKLNDMENSLELIKISNSKELMRDAFRSYAVDLLKGTVIFTYLAVFEHLRKGCISIKDYQNNELKQWIEKTFESEDDYTSEKNIAEKLYSENIISRQQFEYLADLVYKRNQCAHASSEFYLTKEDARYLYNNAIELFLCQKYISGRTVIDGFLSHIKDNEFAFYNKNIQQIERMIKDYIAFDFVNSGYLYSRICELYKQTTFEYVRNNLQYVLYTICKNSPDIYNYFMRKSFKRICSADNDYECFIYFLLLSINPEMITNFAEERDRDNWFRVFYKIVTSRKEHYISNYIKGFDYIDFEEYGENYLLAFLSSDLEHKFSDIDDLFKYIYDILNKVDFNVVDRYIPSFIPHFQRISSILSSEQCYKLYLRLIKNDILLWKDSVINLIDGSESFYSNIREKSLSFILEKSSDVDYEEILFSSNFYCNHARRICDPNNENINLWDFFIKDTDSLKLMFASLCSKRSLIEFIKNNFETIEKCRSFDEKEKALLKYLDENKEESF